MSEPVAAETDLGERPIVSFSGPYRFLSNPFPCTIWWEGVYYPSAEHAFQAAKSLDHDERTLIASIPDWREAKAYGRQIRLRPGWDWLRRPLMLSVVTMKFAQNWELARDLAQTGQRLLLEGNTWGDTDWGAVPEGHRAWSGQLPWWHHGQQAWAGHNWLGLALMFTREMIADGP